MRTLEAVLKRFTYVRSCTEALAASLSPEDQLLQSMPDCSPTKWHRAHTTWFFETFILKPRGIPAYDPAFAYLFNSYYEAEGPRHPRPRRGMLSRPTCAEVTAYRSAIDARMQALLTSCSDAEREALLPVLLLGLAHEEQHQELLLTDIVHAFWHQPLQPAVRPPERRPRIEEDSAAPLRWFPHPGGVVWLGSDGHDFIFDNEGPRHRVFLEPFELASRPISVGEVRAFIEAGGYQTPTLWLSEGWAWVQQHGHSAPLYTVVEPGSFRVFGVDGVRDASDDAPAGQLTYYEADAIARFLDARLPTEAEWEAVASQLDPQQGNFRERDALRPLALRPLAEGTVRDRPGQLFGDVWEWTMSAYSAYPGFRPVEGAIGEYNGKFMVNQLVLRGGSCYSPRGHLRASYRNFWPANTAFQMTGARLARSLSSTSQEP